MTSNGSRATVLWVSLVLLVVSPLQSQVPSSSGGSQPSSASQSGDQFTFRLSVNRVIVDVVVTDSNGRPVRGLTQQDFSVYEDQRPQNILSFDVHSLDSNPSYFAKLPPMPPNTFVNIATEPERGPLYVLLLDLVNTEREDQPYARQQLLKFAQDKPPGTRFAVFVLSDSLHLVQGFTADRAQLYATLDPSHSIPHVPRIFLLGANYGKADPVTMLTAFQLIALYLDGLPGRKNIIWASGSFPLTLVPHDGDPPDVQAKAREMFDALARAECAIYPVDITGVQVFPTGRLTGTSSPGAASTGSASNSVAPGAGQVTPAGGFAPGPTAAGGGGPLISEMTLAGGDASPTESAMAQDQIAKITGGRAFHGRNDLSNLLEEATEAGSDYYTLTYSPSDQSFDGKMRNIRVQLNSESKGFHLEYRREYLATSAPSQIMPVRNKPQKGEDTANLRPIGDSLSAYMQHGAPTARMVYFRAHVHAITPLHLGTAEQMAKLVDQPTYFHIRQRKHPNKALSPVKLQTYLIEYQIIARIPKLEVAAGAYDDEGRLLNGDVEEASSANPSTPDAQAKFTYFRVQQKIDVPVNSVSLRLGVRDLSTDRMGTLEIPLPLAPEPAEAALSDSGSAHAPAQKP